MSLKPRAGIASALSSRNYEQVPVNRPVLKPLGNNRHVLGGRHVPARRRRIPLHLVGISAIAKLFGGERKRSSHWRFCVEDPGLRCCLRPFLGFEIRDECRTPYPDWGEVFANAAEDNAGVGRLERGFRDGQPVCAEAD